MSIGLPEQNPLPRSVQNLILDLEYLYSGVHHPHPGLVISVARRMHLVAARLEETLPPHLNSANPALDWTPPTWTLPRR